MQRLCKMSFSVFFSIQPASTPEPAWRKNNKPTLKSNPDPSFKMFRVSPVSCVCKFNQTLMPTSLTSTRPPPFSLKPNRFRDSPGPVLTRVRKRQQRSVSLLWTRVIAMARDKQIWHLWALRTFPLHSLPTGTSAQAPFPWAQLKQISAPALSLALPLPVPLPPARP